MEQGADTIIVSNYKSIDQMRAEGGCGYWAIGDNVNTIAKHKIRHVLCVFNRSRAKKEHQPLTHQNGERYFIANLNGLPTLHRHNYKDASGYHRGRQLLRLEKYAEFPSGTIEF